MITRTEQTSWTAGQWSDFLDAYGDYNISITTRRYGPNWEHHSGESKSARCDDLFDACLAGGYLVRVYADSETGVVEVERLASEAAGTQSWSSISITLTIDTGIPPSLAVSGNAVRIFYYDGSNIKYVECSDITAGTPTFGSAQTVVSAADLSFMAAVSTTKVHYGLMTSQNNRRMYYAEYTASWATTSSDIYWPFRVYSFDAVALDDYDLLLMTTMLPPLIDSRVVGSELQKVPEMVQAIVAFRVANGRWSDHVEWDVMDNIDTSPARTHLRALKENDIVLVSYLRRGGSEDYEYAKPVVSRTLDGTNWEFPEFMDGSLSDFDTPAVVIPRSDYLYAVGISDTQRSDLCAWAGQTPSEQDISDYLRAFQFASDEVSQIATEVQNPNGDLDNTLINETARTQLTCNLGWVVDGTVRQLQVALADVLSWGNADRLAYQSIAINARDAMDRINRIKSDFAAEWASMQGGRDQLLDTTGTGYGGTRFLATLEGSITADEGTVDVKSHNRETLAVSTFVSDALNGSIQAGILLNYDNKGEYGGVVTRVFDKSNFLAAVWQPDNSKIVLFQREGEDDDSNDTELDSADPGWSVGAVNHIKLVTHYGMAYTYISSDGADWNTLMSTEVPGQPDSAMTYPIISGRMGLIGYGYSDTDTPEPWEPDPWPGPEPWPSWEGDVQMSVLWNASQFGVTLDLLRHHVVSTATTGTTGKTLYDTSLDSSPTSDFTSVGVTAGDLVENLSTHARTTVDSVDSGTKLTLVADIGLLSGSAYHISGTEWHDASGTIDLSSEKIIDFKYVRTGPDAVGGWILTDQALYWSSNILISSPTWSSKLTRANIQNGGTYEMVDSGGTASFKAIAVDTSTPERAVVNIWVSEGHGLLDGDYVYGALETLDTGASWAKVSFQPNNEGLGQWSRPYETTFESIAIDGGTIYANRQIPGTAIPSRPAYEEVWVDGSITGGTRCDRIGHYCACYSMLVVNGIVYIVAQEEPDTYCTDVPMYYLASSSDCGQTFGAISLDSRYDPRSQATLFVNKTDDQDVVVVVYDSTDTDCVLLRSKNGGTTWTEIANMTSLFGVGCALCSPWVACAPWIWESDANVLCLPGRLKLSAWTDEFAFYSDDNGATWCNKRGDWISVFGDWEGNDNSDSNKCELVPLPRLGANA